MILLKGLFLGLLIAIPVGPVGMLCIQRTLNKGRLSGFVSGLGAATADAFYGAVVAFGLVVILNFFAERQFIIRLVGVIFFLYIGTKTYFSPPVGAADDKVKGPNIFLDYVSTLILTATNPMTIISFTALFAGVGLGSTDHQTFSAILLVAGVFLGSTLWWLSLSMGIGWIKKNMSDFSLNSVNRVSGMVIVIFALLILGYLIKSVL
jgi:threonine/homoserine/homoserine lactone efflux protein